MTAVEEIRHVCTFCGTAAGTVAVDAGALAEIQDFVRELRPMLDQLNEFEARWIELQPFIAELRPMLQQLAGVAKGGAPAMLGYLLGRTPAPPAPPDHPSTSGRKWR
jgi:hypothetical protein